MGHLDKAKIKQRPLKAEIYNFFVTFKQSTWLIVAVPQYTQNNTSIPVERNSTCKTKILQNAINLLPPTALHFTAKMCWGPAHLHPVC